MSQQLDKLKALQSSQVQSSKTLFNTVVIHVGIEPTPHYPKVMQNGVKVKNDKGEDVRSDVSDGWTYTFSEFATAKKVMIVLKQKVNLELLKAYKIAGLGYDLKKANLLFIDSNTQISEY